MVLTGGFQAVWADVVATSPDGSSVTATFKIVGGRLTYNVVRGGTTVVEDSPLGISVRPNNAGSALDLGSGASLGTPTVTTVNESYAYLGNHSTAVNNATEYSIPVTSNGRTWNLRVHVQNDGVAYRYEVPLQAGETYFSINAEASSWKLPTGADAWYINKANSTHYEGSYSENLAQNITNGTQLLGPLVYKLPGSGGYAAVTEGALYNYSGMDLQSDGSRTLKAIFPEYQLRSDTETSDKSPAAFLPDDRWRQFGAVESPWRITMVSPDLNGLVNNDIVHNVNPPARTDLVDARTGQAVNWSFVKPGRSLWSWWSDGNVTFEKQQQYVDYAKQMGFQYVLVDAGWTSWTNPWSKIDSLVAQGGNDVKIWLWYSYSSMDRGTSYDQAHFRGEIWPWGVDRSSVLATAASHGVVGVKVDYMDSECEQSANFYEGVLADAARYGLMVNFHGAYKPTGEDRTYPNEITREAVMGLEYNRSGGGDGANHNVLLPFTRLLAGHMDYTPVTFTQSKMAGTSWAHQLATAVLFTSPMQHWAKDPAVLLANPAIDVIKDMPTVWDQTLVLPASTIGNLAAEARKNGQKWFVGVLADDQAHSLNVDLTFLDPNKPYRAVILRDNLSTQTAYNRTVELKYSDNAALAVQTRASGGFVAEFAPALLGDTNLDNDVDGDDFVALAVNYTGTGGTGKTWQTGDFDRDGDVDGDDFVALAVNYTGTLSAPVPEPATAGLLGLGLMFLAGRRKLPA